ALGAHPERLPADRDLPVAGLDLGVEDLVNGVVLKKVRERLRIRQIVDAHDLHVCPAFRDGPIKVAPDPSESVDAYLYAHRESLPLNSCLSAYRRERAGSNPAARAMRRRRSAAAAFVTGGEQSRPNSSRLASGYARRSSATSRGAAGSAPSPCRWT